MSEANQPIDIRSVIAGSHPSGRNDVKFAYREFVTGVPVNIHRYFARSWATTLLARVALTHENDQARPLDSNAK